MLKTSPRKGGKQYWESEKTKHGNTGFSKVSQYDADAQAKRMDDWQCTDSYGLDFCLRCHNCRFCNDSNDLTNCHRCNTCHTMSDCNLCFECNNCKGLKNSHFSNYCTGGHHLYDCTSCTDCVYCRRSYKLTDCHYCDNSARCIGLKDAPNYADNKEIVVSKWNKWVDPVNVSPEKKAALAKEKADDEAAARKLLDDLDGETIE